MISSHKKKLVRQKSINMSSPPPVSQSRFTWENNLNWNTLSYYHDPLTRSLSTESSASHSNSSNPVVVSTKYFYRRK
jgi:hypothetical protein